ncbi:MAG TPA: fibronectin type III domain-containing protein [Candidatus Dormibacteraeota bacterium]|nr:fibronectin type III domain-containing protein [Candidatus Dormibacteraeota bacterium]
MHRLGALCIACLLALAPSPVRAASPYGSPDYGDPPGWCTNFSDMWIASVVTNDPSVASNPERDTFYGFHKNPGYDDWYGFFYGDFRGTPGDASGWVRLLHEDYPRHYHWNFGDHGWAIHGHAKEYIAYYNWTFGGQCGIGRYGAAWPPPFMADQYGYPVVDIYVDAVPPYPPRPHVTAVTPASVSFTWDPVADRGDGAGRDYFVAGMDHYVSWVTVADRAGVQQLASTPDPRVVVVNGLNPGETACAHVEAVDRAGNSTGDQESCGAPLTPPAMPSWPAPSLRVESNPSAPGLVGFQTWFWLSPAPASMTVTDDAGGARYLITATPAGVDWDFGDGTTSPLAGPAGFGLAYPRPSTVTHVYQAHSEPGFVVRASVRYTVTWTASADGKSFGPYPLGSLVLDLPPLTYKVGQAQPELVLV